MVQLCLWHAPCRQTGLTASNWYGVCQLVSLSFWSNTNWGWCCWCCNGATLFVVLFSWCLCSCAYFPSHCLWRPLLPPPPHCTTAYHPQAWTGDLAARQAGLHENRQCDRPRVSERCFSLFDICSDFFFLSVSHLSSCTLTLSLLASLPDVLLCVMTLCSSCRCQRLHSLYIQYMYVYIPCVEMNFIAPCWLLEINVGVSISLWIPTNWPKTSLYHFILVSMVIGEVQPIPPVAGWGHCIQDSSAVHHRDRNFPLTFTAVVNWELTTTHWSVVF